MNDASKTNEIPTKNDIWRWNILISSLPAICKNRPKRFTANPKAISETLVRFHASNVRSAAKSTLGSFNSDMMYGPNGEFRGATLGAYLETTGCGIFNTFC